MTNNNCLQTEHFPSTFYGLDLSGFIPKDPIRGGFRGGVRGVRPPKIRKAYVIQR